MKIVHVVYSMELGGAEMLVAQLGRMQRAVGHDVTVCAYSKLGPLGELLRDEGLRVHVMGEAPVATTMLRYVKLLLAMRPDVVHCHNPAPTLQAAFGARLAGARVISTRHSLVSPPYDRSAEIKFSLIARAFVHRVAGICEITCENLRGAPLAARKQIVRVYNGADPVEDAPAANREDGTFVLLFVGRVAAIKDLPTMLRAFALAVERVPALRLWIVGDGSIRSELERLAGELEIADRVQFFGQRLDTAGFFRAADAFAMSSVSEGLPMSLLQAMSVGLPALVTDVGGMREVLQLSNGGLRTPVGDCEGMAAAMVRMATEDELRRTCGRQAQRAYSEHFTLQQMNAAYLQLYAKR
ncbi:MAG: glycosyltransferase family 4 protein [Janthinobacterium lividum]